jgi:hypothetical protein
MNKGAKEKTNQRAQCSTKPLKTRAINIFYATSFVRKNLFVI